MCGIAGLFNVQRILPEPAAALAVVEKMTASFAYRGPDSDGHWADPRLRCFLGHRRLSIIDTSDAGHQPMAGSDGEWVISFNGELYNFQELRPHLEREGVTFRGRTDTEVLLESLALWGLDALPKLDGMFVFAAFNVKSGELILARDAFGEKPLYYMSVEGGGLAFASELHALQAVPGFDPKISLDAMAEVLMFQYIGAPRTIYQAVRKLPPGHWLSIKPGESPRIGRYFEFLPGSTGFHSGTKADLADELEDILVRSIRRRLVADVPLGAFLSGGVDSSIVCALARRRLGVPLNTFSMGFQGASESEHETARKFAVYLGTEHHEKVLAPSAGDFLRDIGRLLDEPNADSSCLPTYLLSEFARTRVTVAVSGDGGDEMFGGYGRYFATLDEARSAPSRTWRPGEAYYANRILVSTEVHVEELFGYVPPGLREHLGRLRETLNQPTPPLACLLRKTDVDNYMPGAVLAKVDRMSMRHSLEVRTPFLNVELARFAERLPEAMLYADGKGKLLLREVAYRYLPRELIDLPKQGFGLPMSAWGKDSLLGVARDLLETRESVLGRALGGKAIERFMTRQRSKTGYATYQVWALAMLESWLRHHPHDIPTLEPRKARVVPSSTTSATEHGVELHAVHVSGRVWAIVPAATLPTATRESEALGAHQQLEDFNRHLLRAATILFPDEVPVRDESPVASVRLGTSDWSALSTAVALPGSPLAGSALLMTDPSAAGTLDCAQLHGFRSAGIRSIVVPHPYRSGGAVVLINIRPKKSRIEEWRSRQRLRRRRVASWFGWRTARSGGYKRDVGPFAGIQGPPDTELSHRYAVFEGDLQLPPLPWAHTDIRERGGGRYSVWSRTLAYAPSSPGRAAHRYWVVEQNSETRADLQFTVDHVDDVMPDAAGFVESLGRVIDAPSIRSGSRLAPGDHVALITSGLPPGGAERQWCYLAIGLKQRGLRVTFIVLEWLEGLNAHYLPLLRAHDIQVLEVGRQDALATLAWRPERDESKALLLPGANPFGIRLVQLSALLAALQPRAVFAQLDMPNLIAGVAGEIAGVPRTVLSFRNYNPWTFSYLRVDWFLPCYRALARSPRVAMSGNSHAANLDYANWMGIEPSRVAFVPNAIEVEDFPAPDDARRETVRRELGLVPGDPVLLGVFRLSEEKNPLGFIEVCDRARRDVPELRVLIAGIGPMQQQVAAEVERRGLGGCIQLLGRRDDVAALLSIATLLLLASNFEGMPNVVMEAQLCGIPAVATRTGGTPDVLRHGETGFMADPGDDRGLAEHCVRLLRDPALAQRMGAAGAEWMRGAFSRSRMVERYVEIVDNGSAAQLRERQQDEIIRASMKAP